MKCINLINKHISTPTWLEFSQTSLDFNVLRIKTATAQADKDVILNLLSICRYGKNQGKREGKDQESIQSSTTPDPGHHMEK